MLKQFALIFALSTLLGLSALAQPGVQQPAEWTQPIKPFRIIGNIYWVGSADLGSFLITTPEGHILLDVGLQENVPLVKESIQKLGFKLEDVKIILNTQSHFDHAAGFAEMKKATGAKLAVMDGDAQMVERGGKGDFAWGDQYAYPAAKVDRVLHDKDTIKLGGVTMTARLTPGHTRGCTTWLMKVNEGGKTYNVVIIGSASVPGYTLVDNKNYPEIISDYEKTFRLLKTFQSDIFLGPHGSFFDLSGKLKKLEQGTKENPFVDSQGLQEYVKRAEGAFRAQVERERAEKVKHAGLK
ncbi:MAG TPA: subclass B3 metallo-beta-lactamase [Blastocatellia bacterium]|nr:subclass B3 metallo-beta-lactamase [Blastocatellia bacterium]